MKYIIYTDGSCSFKEGKSASSYFIRTKEDFITLGCESYDGNSIAIAESIAIGLAVKALMEEVEIVPEDRVLIRTDCESVLTFFENVDTEGGWPKTKNYKCKEAWWLFKKLNSMCNVELKKITAHADEVNGNKVADRIAKYFVRFNCM